MRRYVCGPLRFFFILRILKKGIGVMTLLLLQISVCNSIATGDAGEAPWDCNRSKWTAHSLYGDGKVHNTNMVQAASDCCASCKNVDQCAAWYVDVRPHSMAFKQSRTRWRKYANNCCCCDHVPCLDMCSKFLPQRHLLAPQYMQNLVYTATLLSLSPSAGTSGRLTAHRRGRASYTSQTK